MGVLDWLVDRVDDLGVDMLPRSPAGVIDAARAVLAARVASIRARERASAAAAPDVMFSSCVCEDFCREHAQQPQVRSRIPDLRAAAPSFAARLLIWVRDRFNGNAPLVYRRAGMSRKNYSRIVSDELHHVSKRTAMQFALGLQLSRADAELLLKSAGYAFSDAISEDVVFLYCIEHAIWNLEDVNVLLLHCGLTPISS